MSRMQHVLRVATVPFVALSFLFVAPGSAEDWPQWRGKDRLGVWHETGLVESFPKGGLVFSWKVPIRSGFAGPAVADGRVFVLDWQKDPESRRMEGTERLVVLDEATGKTLWTDEWPASYASIQASYAIGPRATPTVDGSRVYVVGAVGALRAYDSRTGDLSWSHDFVKEYDTTIPVWGTTSAPLIDGDLLITLAGAEPDGQVIAYDKKTGQEVWRSLPTNTEIGYGQPVILEAAGKRQLIIWHPSAVSSLDPETGEVYWQVEWSVGQGMTVATPVFSERRLLVSQFYAGSMMLALDDEKPGAEILWQGKSKSELPDKTDGLHSLITTPILEGGTVYGVCSYGELRALDALTGERLWVDTTLTRQGRWGAAFFVRNGDRYFVNNDLGDLILARFTRQGVEEIDRTKLLEPTSHAGYGPRRFADALVNWSHPAYANGHIVARNDEVIVRASLRAEARSGTSGQ